MPRPTSKPAPKLQATRVPPATRTRKGSSAHEEDVIDEALDESFPASDPAAIASPSGSLAAKHTAKKKK